MSAARLTLATQLAAELEAEIQGQERLLECLTTQRDAVLTGSSEVVEQCGSALESELDQVAQRAPRRAALLRALAQDLGVPHSTLTVAALCERLAHEGASIGQRLAEKRERLRDLSGRVSRDARRNATVVSRQRGLVRELLGTILATDDTAGEPASGTLIDASA